MKKHVALFCLVAGFCAGKLFAIGTPATDAEFRYQGRLTNSGGTPQTGSFDFEFSLHDNVIGGLQVGPTVTKSTVSVSGGVFDVTLDFGTSALDGHKRWLEIRVRASGGGGFTTLTPRQQLTAVPYAAQVINGAIGALQLSTSATPSAGQALLYSTTASGNVTWGTVQGIFQIAGSTISNINPTTGSFVFGSSQIEDIFGQTGDDDRFFYDRDKGALYGGSFVSAGGFMWDNDLTGTNATVLGRNNIASGEFSVAMGAGNMATGTGSVALGGGNAGDNDASGRNSLALGELDNFASGDFSLAVGQRSNNADGDYTLALGNNKNFATGNYTLAMGHNDNAAEQDYSIAIGSANNKASASYSIAMGRAANAAQGNYSIAIGNNDNVSGGSYTLAFGQNRNEASGDYSLAFGQGQNEASGNYSLAIGQSSNSASADYTMALGRASNQATQSYSLAIGSASNMATATYTLAIGSNDNKATDSYATARGANNNIASGKYSLAVGSSENIASGDHAFAMGQSKNRAEGKYSLAFGSNENIAHADNSAVIGKDNEAHANASMGFGQGTIARSWGEMAVGVYTTTYTAGSTTAFDAADRVFVVGNGQSEVLRSDAFEIRKSGDAKLFGNLTVTNATVTTQVSTASIKVGTSGVVINEVIKRTVNVDLPSVGAGASADVAITFSGATTGATVQLSPSTLLTAGLIVSSVNASAGQVNVRLWNASGGAIDMAAMDIYITVIK